MLYKIEEQAEKKLLTFSGWLMWKGIVTDIKDPQLSEHHEEYRTWLNDE